jgi:hypothetical protein
MSASRRAHRSAASAPADSSTPTTMRFIVPPADDERTVGSPQGRHLVRRGRHIEPSNVAFSQITAIAGLAASTPSRPNTHRPWAGGASVGSTTSQRVVGPWDQSQHPSMSGTSARHGDRPRRRRGGSSLDHTDNRSGRQRPGGPHRLPPRTAPLRQVRGDDGAYGEESEHGQRGRCVYALNSTHAYNEA